MGSLRISKRVVDALETTGSEYFVWDSDLIGFGVRVRGSGAKTYVAKYRAGKGRNAPTRRLTIGAIGKLTPDEARRLAKVKLGEAATGGDPAADRAKERADMTISALTDLYLAEGCDLKKASTLATDRGRIERHIKPLLGRRRVSEVNSLDIERFMRDVANGKTAVNEKSPNKGGRIRVTGGRGTATRTVRLLGGIFSFAVRQGLRSDNPTKGVTKYPDNKNERFLSTEELERLGSSIREGETVGIPWQVAVDGETLLTSKHLPKAEESRRAKLSPFAAAALRLLIFTGARLREILHLQWDHVDLERGLLLLPDSKTGKKTIILNSAALAVLVSLPRHGNYVIPGESRRSQGNETTKESTDRPRHDLKRPWDLVSTRAGLPNVRLHDLRHTNASIGAAAGLGLPIIGKLLGHTQASTTARYAHLDNDPLRRAADRIGEDLLRAMGEATPADENSLMATRIKAEA